jgi:hypothetical protein
MADNLIGTFDTAEMLAAIDATPRPRTFFRERLFGGNIRTFLTKSVTADFCKGQRALAPFVNRRIGGKLVEKLAFESRNYEPPMVASRAVFHGDEAFERTMGEVIGGSSDPNTRMTDNRARELTNHDRMVTRTEEVMNSQMMATGIITIVGEGVSDEIDLSHTNTDLLAGDSRWGESGADPVINFHEWKRECLRLSGITPDTVVLGSDAADAFLEDSKVRDLLDVRNIMIGQINPRDVPSGAIWLGTIDGVDVFEYPEWYIHPTTGVETPMVAANKAIMFPSAARNPGAIMLYGAYYDVKNQQTIVGSRIPRTWVEEGPNTEMLELICFPLPVMPDVDSWLVATVMDA